MATNAHPEGMAKPCLIPSAIPFCLGLPGGRAQALGFRSMSQLAEPGGDPDSVERLLLELLDGDR
jgi:hypothetical protein